jgi:hypothetical protein
MNYTMKSIFIQYIFTFSLLIFIACPPDSPIPGCMDNAACNYNASATEDDSSCVFPESGYDCTGECLIDSDGDGICDDFEVVGCMDSTACNYDTLATDTGDCFYEPDALPNPIEITYIEEEITGSVGEELVAKIHVRNSSCEIMNDLTVRKIFNNQVNPDVTVWFCFNEICFPSSTDTAPNSLLLNSFEEDDYFKGYLEAEVAGVYEVNYRFYLENEPSQNTQVTITYTVN